MTTLVTGAGLVGAAFAQAAIARGERVVFFDPEPRGEFLRVKLGETGYEAVRGDVRDLPALIATIRERGADTLVHTAGLIGGSVDANLYTALQINVMGTINVAEAVRLTGVRRLVHISTFGVYDYRRELPATIREDFPRGPGRGYGNSKVAKELIVEAYQRKHGFEAIVLRLSNVFGLGHFFAGSGGGQMVQALLEAGMTGTPARIAASQVMANEYVYAKDVGRAVDLAATVPLPKRTVFNVGSGVVTSHAELIATIRKLLPDLKIDVQPGEPPSAKERPLDISAAKAHLGWEPRYSLAAAFEDYLRELRAVGPGAKTRLRA